MRVRLPAPHDGQQTVIRQAKRFNWLAAGRRWRKTTLVMAICVEAALKRQRIIWGAPVYDQVRIGWDETKHALIEVAEFNQSRMEVSLPTGGSILFRSLDDPDNARGHSADGVVMDECADIKPDAWYQVLRPMLMDTNGWAWGIGTPKGRNWFWQESIAALESSDAMAWQVPTVGAEIQAGRLVRAPHPLENPNIPFSEIERLFATMPEAIFRQEILAEFTELGAGVFRRVTEAATAQPQDRRTEIGEYVFGVDWGKLADFTWITVLDVERREMVAMERFNQIDYRFQLKRLQGLYDRFKPTTIIAESNSMGEPLIEALDDLGLPVQAFVTTNASKKRAVEALALALERGDLTILNEPILIAELQAYEAKRLPSGLIRYGAPDGMHDDGVISLALAYSGLEGGLEPIDQELAGVLTGYMGR